MRTLTIFIDMLNTNYLKTYQKEITETNLDNFIRKFGGTTFTNIYTPAPDTSRSLSSFWSGKPPYVNGCNQRGKYPSFFLEMDTFLDKLLSLDVKIDLFGDRKDIFPKCVFDDVFFRNSIEEINKYDDQFIFLDLLDSHNLLDDMGYSLKGIQMANKQVTKSLEYIFSCLEKNTFDRVIFFSDHGHSVTFKTKYDSNPDSWMSDGRTRILLHIWNKTDDSHIINNEFGSIMDLHDYYIDLFDKTKKNHILSNYQDFYPKSNQLLLVEDTVTLNSFHYDNPNIWRLKDSKHDFVFHFKNDSHSFELFTKLNLSFELEKKFPHLMNIVQSNMKFFYMHEFIRERDLDKEKKIYWYYFDNTPRHYSKIRRFGHSIIPKKFKSYNWHQKVFSLVKKYLKTKNN